MPEFPVPALEAAAGSAAGRVLEVEVIPTRRGGPRVWRVVGVDAEVYLKQHARGRGYEQERAALTTWARALAGRAPALLAFDDGARALLMSAVAGGRASELEGEDELAVHRAAGRWLAALHALDPGPRDPVSLDEAVASRLVAAITRAPAELGPAGRRELDWAVANAGVFARATRVACHRDFVPDNWRWDGERLGVVDFEHARADCWLVDLVKLATTVWVRRPDLERAFLAGYGRALDDPDRVRLRVLTALHGVVSWTWGEQHGDAELADHGRRLLDAP